MLTRPGVDYLSPAWIIWCESSPGMTYYTTSSNDGVIQEIQIWVFTLITIKVDQPTKQGFYITGMNYFIFLRFDYQSNLFLGIMTRPAVNRQDPCLFMCTQELHIMIPESKLTLIRRITQSISSCTMAADHHKFFAILLHGTPRLKIWNYSWIVPDISTALTD